MFANVLHSFTLPACACVCVLSRAKNVRQKCPDLGQVSFSSAVTAHRQRKKKHPKRPANRKLLRSALSTLALLSVPRDRLFSWPYWRHSPSHSHGRFTSAIAFAKYNTPNDRHTLPSHQLCKSACKHSTQSGAGKNKGKQMIAVFGKPAVRERIVGQRGCANATIAVRFFSLFSERCFPCLLPFYSL